MEVISTQSLLYCAHNSSFKLRLPSWRSRYDMQTPRLVHCKRHAVLFSRWSFAIAIQGICLQITHIMDKKNGILFFFYRKTSQCALLHTKCLLKCVSNMATRSEKKYSTNKLRLFPSQKSFTHKIQSNRNYPSLIENFCHLTHKHFFILYFDTSIDASEFGVCIENIRIKGHFG